MYINKNNNNFNKYFTNINRNAAPKKEIVEGKTMITYGKDNVFKKP